MASTYAQPFLCDFLASPAPNRIEDDGEDEDGRAEETVERHQCLAFFIVSRCLENTNTPGTAVCPMHFFLQIAPREHNEHAGDSEDSCSERREDVDRHMKAQKFDDGEQHRADNAVDDEFLQKAQGQV